MKEYLESRIKELSIEIQKSRKVKESYFGQKMIDNEDKLDLELEIIQYDAMRQEAKRALKFLNSTK